MRILCIKLEINQGYNNTNYVTSLGTHSSQPEFKFYLRARSIAFRPRYWGVMPAMLRFCNWLQPQLYNWPGIIFAGETQFERYSAVLSTYKRNT